MKCKECVHYDFCTEMTNAYGGKQNPKNCRWAKTDNVRHGAWCLIEYEYLVCDKCGGSRYTGCESTAEAKERLKNGDVPPYCENCGAKMEGDNQ